MTERQQLSVVAICGVGAIIMLIILALQGCASWQETTGRSLQAVHEVAKASSSVVEPHYRVKCGKVARTCSGLPCEALAACQHERSRVNSAIKALHRAVRAMVKVVPLIDEARKAIRK